ncbi:MAG: hypothetical protein IPN86_00110 [Saprospiraceae bacterium]|nr:hypothetical protein [Saprospiraceae bacterium]
MVIRQMPLPTQVIWVKEFAELESEFKKYEKEKKKLSQSFQNKMNILRGVLVVSFGMMFYFIGSPLVFHLSSGLSQVPLVVFLQGV